MKKVVFILLTITSLTGCKKFLDVIPDNIPTIDNAFTLKTEAEKYLFTCYSYLPNESDYSSNPAFLAGDEYWIDPEWSNYDNQGIRMAMGFQNASNPMFNMWSTMYKGIRDCNIFLDNISKVPDIQETLRQRWIGEVKFLKAYYHWQLFRMYGPIPLIDKNMPISSGVDEVKLFRQPADSAVNFISRLLDEATTTLPLKITNTQEELGRITKPIALSIKARVLVTAASPLYNGNTAYGDLKNADKSGSLMNQSYSEEKWARAAKACKDAITACEEATLTLFRFNDPSVFISDALKTQMSIRNAIAEKWNSELIWGSTNSPVDGELQRFAMPRLNPAFPENVANLGQLAPTLKIAETFYTKNGVPIEEDKTWHYETRYSTQQAADSDADFLTPGYTTSLMNFDLEPRFYADMGFDGGVWYQYDGTWHVEAKFGQEQAQKSRDSYSMTGYYTKKLVSWKYIIKENRQNSTETFPWPMMRLADLYLLYAEASNEEKGPNTEAYDYINRVRERAGLKSVQESWSTYSTRPGKFTTKEGLRDIIQQERLIELAFEANRFWDLRRWKRAQEELNEPIRGWDISQVETSFYYKPKVLFQQNFQPKEYLWPIQQQDILVNPNLVQNTGW